MESTVITCAGDVASMGETGNAYEILTGTPECERALRKLCKDAKIILQRFLKKQNMKVWAGFSFLRVQTYSVGLRAGRSGF
jgi:hypothetical protein